MDFVGGSRHNVLVNKNGTLWTIGHNRYGQIGDGTFTDRKELVQIGSDSDWQYVGAGTYHSTAIKKDGSLWTWGRNLHGCLGNGETEISSIPIPIGSFTQWKKVGAGGFFTIALDINGEIWSWGDNTRGSLGDGTFEDRFTPVYIECPQSGRPTELFDIYPNPTLQTININWRKPPAEDVIYKIWTNYGGLVIAPTPLSNLESIDVSELNAGVYILRISANEDQHTTRFVKL